MPGTRDDTDPRKIQHGDVSHSFVLLVFDLSRLPKVLFYTKYHASPESTRKDRYFLTNKEKEVTSIGYSVNKQASFV
jgi:hypothetical protein